MSAKTAEDGVEADTQKKSAKKCQCHCKKREVPIHAIEVGHDGTPMVGLLTVEEYEIAPEDILMVSGEFSTENSDLISKWRKKRENKWNRFGEKNTEGEVEERTGEIGKGKEKTPNHYDLAIQPVDFINSNGLGFLEGNVIKYVTRHKKKNGAEDIRKAMHYLEMILEKDYGEQL